MRTSMRAMITGLLLLLAWPLCADEIHLRNKDVVRGKILALQDKTITFESESFGTIKVDRAKVDRVVFQEATGMATALVPPNAVCEGDECKLPLPGIAPKVVSIQVLLQGLEGARLQPLDVQGRDTIVLPGRCNVTPGQSRFRLTQAKGHEQRIFLLTLDVGEVPLGDVAHINANAIPIELNNDSLALATSGEEVTEEFAISRDTIVFPAPPPLIKLTLELEPSATSSILWTKLREWIK